MPVAQEACLKGERSSFAPSPGFFFFLSLHALLGPCWELATALLRFNRVHEQRLLASGPSLQGLLWETALD